jgi:mannose/fructose-specific phosphotransferase system component IIA
MDGGRLSLSAKTLNRRLILALSAMAAVVVLQDIVGASPARALTTTPDDT